MTLRFGQTRGDDVAALIARKQYPRAIEVITEQLKTQRNDPRIRIQLSDVLILAERPREAMAILSALADEFARDGFATKAIAVLKKIQKVDPTQRGVEARLASLIQEKQQHTASPGPAGRGREIGMEAAPSGIDPGAGEGLELDIGFGATSLSAPVSTRPAAPAAPAAPAPPAPVEDRDLILEEPAPVTMAEMDLADIEPEAIEETYAEPDPIELDIGAVALEAEPIVDDPRADADFAQELLAVIEGVFPTAPGLMPPAAPAPAGVPSRMVVSPLFRDFSVDEMVAVIQGLKLLAFEAGDVILSQGERGESLYMLTAGRVKAFVRGGDGRQSAVGELSEGAFFGEMSILTGQPRSATIVAASRCELLELDRATLDAITRDHPRVWDVLREFAARRARRTPSS